MLASLYYEQNQRSEIIAGDVLPRQKRPRLQAPKENSLLFKQIQLKVANLREAEEAGLAEPGTADRFLAQVQAIVRGDTL